jgi:hypothetical protein
MLTNLIAYESGQLDEEETLELFREIRDTNAQAWLQGHYGRTLAYLEDEGLL